tara:strand:+ start:2136 stop:2828 length:693 start_codon:yes stop_codon:yes gene_type:complete
VSDINRPTAEISADVTLLLDALAEGGTGIVPLDVAYAICASREVGIRAIFTAKQRSYEKPSGLLADVSMSRAIHQLEEWQHDLAASIVQEDKLPFSVVAPFDASHPFFAGVDPFVMQSSTKVGTLDMLLNAGSFHDEIARQSWARGQPVFGSSANASLTGSKYRYGDVDDAVRAAASIYFDYGEVRYANPAGRSSTIIDFTNWHVIREGVVFDAVDAAFARHGVSLVRAV